MLIKYVSMLVTYISEIFMRIQCNNQIMYVDILDR